MKASLLADILASAAPGQAVDRTLRVRYGETDKMGVAYYGSYLDWFEHGRTELIRSRGLSYKKMEEEGLFLPVRESFCRYKAPLEYDDEFTLTTELCLVERHKVIFRNRIVKDDVVRAEGGTMHISTNAEGKIVTLPERIAALLKAPNQ